MWRSPHPATRVICGAGGRHLRGVRRAAGRSPAAQGPPKAGAVFCRAPPQEAGSAPPSLLRALVLAPLSPNFFHGAIDAESKNQLRSETSNFNWL